MLKVLGLGVIKVKHLSETSFCELPLISPKAPSPFITSVKANSIMLVIAFFLSFIVFTPILYFSIPKNKNYSLSLDKFSKVMEVKI